MNKLKMMMVVMWAASSVSALPMIGPPKAQEETKMGLEYSHSRNDAILHGHDIELMNRDTQHRFDEITTDDIIGRLIFPLSEKSSMSILAGVTSSEEDRFESQTGLLVGVGINATIKEWDNLNLGTACQIIYKQADLKSGTLKGDYRILEGLAMVGLNYDVDPFQIYVGPCIYLIDGKVDIVSPLEPSLTIRMDIENEHNGVGLVVGGVWDLSETIHITAEYIITTDMNSFGLGVEIEM